MRRPVYDGRMMNPTAAWLLASMLWALPPASVANCPGNRETATEREERYRSIAEDLSVVVLDPDEAPLFEGPDARARTGAVVLGVTRHESGWNLAVDTGADRGSLAGDAGAGRSWCLGQILLDRDGVAKTPEGWTGPDLVADHKKCFRVVLHMARESFTRCRALPLEERLALYTRGSCNSDTGRALSRPRMRQALVLSVRRAPPSDPLPLEAFLR